MTMRQILQSSEKHNISLSKAYDPVCVYSSHRHNVFKQKIISTSSPAASWAYVQYLRFKVPVNHSYVMHVTDGGHQFAHDAAGLRFTEMLLSADPLQQLTPTKQLQNQVRVELQQTHTQYIYISHQPLLHPHFILWLALK